MTAKNKILSAAFCAIAACVFAAVSLAPSAVVAAQVSFGPFTNATTHQVDLNPFRVFPCSEPAISDGTVYTTGLPIRLTPTSSGKVTNTMAQGHFLITNQFLGRGFIIRVPQDDGLQVYNAFSDLIVSGGGVFVTVYKYSNSPAATYNDITNALGYTPEKTNLLATASNALTGSIVAASNYSAALLTSLSNTMRTADTAISNLFPIAGAAVTNYVLSVGANGTNFTKGVGTSLTNALATLGANATNNDLALGLAGTNFTKLCGSSASNYVLAIAALSSNYIATLYTQATNFAGTNLIAAGQLPTIATQTNGLPATQTTNYIGVYSSGTSSANGTYGWSGSAYTNAQNSELFVTNISGTWYIISNAITFYSSTVLTNGWSVVSGASPAPTVHNGYTVNNYGIVFLGSPISTNASALLQVAINAQAVLQTNDTVSRIAAIGLSDTNFAKLVGTSATNNDTIVSNGVVYYSSALGTIVSNGVIAYANVIGQNATNKANANGTAITNWVTSTRLLSIGGSTTNLGAFGLIATNAVFRSDGTTYAVSILGNSSSDDLRIISGTANGSTGIKLYNSGAVLKFSVDSAGNLSATTLSGTINAGNLSGGVVSNGCLAARAFSDPTFDGDIKFSGDVDGNIGIASVDGSGFYFKTTNYTADIWFTGSHSKFIGTFIGDGTGISNVVASTAGLVTITNGYGTNLVITNTRAYGAFSNMGDSYYPNLADATYPKLFYLNPLTGPNPSKLVPITATGSHTSFLDGAFTLNTSVDISMLPFSIQQVGTNNFGSGTNLNASRLDFGTVPRARQETVLSNLLQGWWVTSGGNMISSNTSATINCGATGGVTAGTFTSAGNNGSFPVSTYTGVVSTDIYGWNDVSSGKKVLWYQQDSPSSGGGDANTIMQSTNLWVHGFAKTDRGSFPTNTAPMIEDNTTLALDTLYTNTSGFRQFLSVTVTNTGTLGYVALVVDRGNGWKTNSTVATYGTMTTVLGPNDHYAISNLAGTWTLQFSQLTH